LGGFYSLRLFAKLLHWLVSFKHLECVAESLALREASRLIPSKARLHFVLLTGTTSVVPFQNFNLFRGSLGFTLATYRSNCLSRGIIRLCLDVL
jgi:hypothetical protein